MVPRFASAFQFLAVAIVVAASTGLALLVAGLIVPGVPALGVVGSLVVSPRAAWFALAGFFCLGVALAIRRSRFRRAGLWTGIAAVITALGAVIILATQWMWAADHGVTLTTADIVGTGSISAPSDSRVTYAEIGGQPLDAEIWRPTETSPSTPESGQLAAPESNRPAVLWVHGGGFTGGSRDEQAGMYRYLADHGYPVISVDYRLAPPPRWSDATADVACALVWVTEHSGDYGIDPSRIVLAGGSAGGSLALNTSYAIAGNDVSSSCGGTPTRPVAVAAFYPASDLAGVFSDNGSFGYGSRAARDYLGGSPAEVPDRYTYASPDQRVMPGLMPTLLITGATDHLIHADRIAALADKLSRAGNQVTYAAVPYSDHAFDAHFHSIGGAVSRNMMLRFLSETVPVS